MPPTRTEAQQMGRAVIPDMARTPPTGVRLAGGLFRTAFEDGIGYLKSPSRDSILYCCPVMG